MKALITDSGYFSGALSAARSLDAAGWTVGIGAPRKGFAHRSRAVGRHHFVPSPEMDLDGFVECINRAVAEEGYEVILPTSDLEMLALSQERERLGGHVPYGPHAGVERALDKLDSTVAALSAGLHAPETRIATPEAVAAIGPEEPVVVKARRHVFLNRGSGTTFRAAALCRGRNEAEARVAGVASEGGEALLQEPVEGRLVSLALIADRGQRLLAAVYQVADRTWPEGVGGTARGHTAAADEQLVEGCSALLADLEWFGLAQIQFLVDPDGRAQFIDLNGRIFGSIALSSAASVNLPALWAEAAVRSSAPGLVTGAAGARYQWFEGDLKRAMLSGPRRFVPELLDSLRYGRGAAHAVWSRQDPLPSLWYTKMLTARLASKVIKRERPAAVSRTS